MSMRKSKSENEKNQPIGEFAATLYLPGHDFHAGVGESATARHGGEQELIPLLRDVLRVR